MVGGFQLRRAPRLAQCRLCHQARGGRRYQLPSPVRAPARGAGDRAAGISRLSATYIAYANTRITLQVDFAEVRRGHLLAYDAEEVFAQEHGETGLSTYDTHSDGSGVRYCSRLRPILNTGLKTRVWNFNADTHCSPGSSTRASPSMSSRMRTSSARPPHCCHATGRWPAAHIPSTGHAHVARAVCLSAIRRPLSLSRRQRILLADRVPSHASRHHRGAPSPAPRPDTGRRSPASIICSFSGELGDLWRRCGDRRRRWSGSGPAPPASIAAPTTASRRRARSADSFHAAGVVSPRSCSATSARSAVERADSRSMRRFRTRHSAACPDRRLLRRALTRHDVCSRGDPVPALDDER